MKKKELTDCLEFHCDNLLNGKDADERYQIITGEIYRLFELLTTDWKAVKKEITSHFNFNNIINLPMILPNGKAIDDDNKKNNLTRL